MPKNAVHSFCWTVTRHLWTRSWDGKAVRGLSKRPRTAPALAGQISQQTWSPWNCTCSWFRCNSSLVFLRVSASGLSLSHCLSPPPSRPHWICIPGHIPCTHRSWNTGCSCGHQWLGPRSQASPRVSRQKPGWAQTQEEEPHPDPISDQMLGSVLTHLRLLLQGQPLDGDEAIGLGITDHYPPALFTFLQWPKAKNFSM